MLIPQNRTWMLDFMLMFAWRFHSPHPVWSGCTGCIYVINILSSFVAWKSHSSVKKKSFKTAGQLTNCRCKSSFAAWRGSDRGRREKRRDVWTTESEGEAVNDTLTNQHWLWRSSCCSHVHICLFSGMNLRWCCSCVQSNWLSHQYKTSVTNLTPAHINEFKFTNKMSVRESLENSLKFLLA